MLLFDIFDWIESESENEQKNGGDWQEARKHLDCGVFVDDAIAAEEAEEQEEEENNNDNEEEEAVKGNDEMHDILIPSAAPVIAQKMNNFYHV